MIEFGLKSVNEETSLITAVKNLEKSLTANDDLVESDLEPEYDIFFDHSYEMADHPSTCLVKNLETTREETFRQACDKYLVMEALRLYIPWDKTNPLLSYDVKYAYNPRMSLATSLTLLETKELERRIEKCIAV